MPRDVTHPDSLIQVWIELDKTILIRSRSIYHVLDFLGDVGGLFDALKLIAQSMLFLLGQGGLVSLLVGKLFYLPLNLTSSILHSSLYFLDPASQRD